MVGKAMIYLVILILIAAFVFSVDSNIGLAISAGIFVVSAYFFPTLIADYRKHQSTTAIFVFNLFLGWTFLGWVLALVWAFVGQKKEEPLPISVNVEPNPVKASSSNSDAGFDMPEFKADPIIVTNSEMQKKLDRALEAWLVKRWEMIDRRELKQDGWYFLNPTERQIGRLERYGLMHPAKNRGQYSDIIGLYEDPKPSDVEIVKFFKHPVRGLSQAQARHLAEVIRGDEEKMQAYANRPASALHKKMYSFCGIKAPSNLSMSQFEADYGDMSDDPKFSDRIIVWEEYIANYEELQDKDVREDYEIKRVSQSVYDSAIAALIKSGMPIHDAVSDLELIVEKILEIKPELQK